jgi:Flp pilus assembly pilin Flp
MEIKMINFIKNFRKDEDGAVTVDWVVLTAAVVGLAIAAYGTIQENTDAVLTSTGGAVLGAQDWLPAAAD